MKTRDYQELYDLEETYWWFVGRRLLVRQMVERYAGRANLRLLDAGCGTGGTLSRMIGLGDLFGFDYSEFALAFCRQRGFSLLAAGDLTALPYCTDIFDVVLSCDVLEHVDDDFLGLAEMVRTLRQGGHLVLTLPAHAFLWSEHDEALSHRRRYSAKHLRKMLEEAGLEVVKLSPVVTVAFLPILAFRLLQRLSPHRSDEPKTDLRELPRPLNNLLIDVLRLENWFLRRLNLPVGTSLVAVARKR
ncbi:MAG: class I SAM-dependent DNA methyltransferase [Bacteroidota bacterium]